MYYVIVVVIWIVCGVASAAIAKVKNRDPVTYGAVGFFFGVIGLIVAIAVPSLKVDDLSCRYLRADTKPSVDKGKLQPTGSGIRFTADDQSYAFDVPFTSISGTQTYSKKTIPKDFPLRSKMLAENMLVLGLQHNAWEQTIISYFSIYKTVLPLFLEQIITPGTQRQFQTQQPQQAYEQIAPNLPAEQAPAVKPSYRITRNVVINGQVAFAEGETVDIETVSPDPNRPEYKYVVLSKSLNQRFRLSDQDIDIR
jgi:hypothetical protein